MKIGIITWFRYENYGTKLQAYALQQFLKTHGYDVSLINFKLDDTPKNQKNKFSIRGKIKGFLNKVDKIVFYKSYKDRKYKFEKFITNNCVLTKFINNEKEYIQVCNSFDVLIFGSDQIWNPNWYNNFYYANYDEIKTKRLAYAPSFGISKDNIKDYNYNEISKALSRFYKIFVREKSGSEIVRTLINKDSKVVVDPTMLLSSEQWEKISNNNLNPKDKYILCYFLSDNSNYFKAVKKYANNRKIIYIPKYGFTLASFNSKMKTTSVENFLSLIKNADCVLTDSFHGTIFSIIFRKNFYVFERHNPTSKESQNSRIYNLLNMFSLNSRMISYNSNTIQEHTSIDYNSINKKIEKIINDSKEELLNTLEELENEK